MSQDGRPVDRRVGELLGDLLAQAQAVSRLVARGKAAFDADEMLRLAAESLLVRLGECVDRLDKADPTFVPAHPALELRPLKDTRNLVAHGYDIVDYALVWAILATDVPRVASAVEAFVRESA